MQRSNLTRRLNELEDCSRVGTYQMTMHLWKVTSVLLVLMFCFAQVEPAFAVDADQKDYVPMREGVEWTMDVVITPDKGEAIQATGHRKVTGIVQRDGKQYFRSLTSMESPGRPAQEASKLVRKDESGFYTIDEQEKDATEQLEIALPLAVGHSWECVVKGVKQKATVISREDVAIGEKIYKDCYHIRTEGADGKVTEDFWEAPNTGSVKSIVVYANQGKMVLTLRSFKAGKE